MLTKIPDELIKWFDDENENRCTDLMYDEFDLESLPAGWTVEVVDSYGGEGMGDDFYNVLAFKKDREVVYVKFQGWYSSYDGSEFQEYYVVEPVEKMITVYEKIKGG